MVLKVVCISLFKVLNECFEVVVLRDKGVLINSVLLSLLSRQLSSSLDVLLEMVAVYL